MKITHPLANSDDHDTFKLQKVNVIMQLDHYGLLFNLNVKWFMFEPTFSLNGGVAADEV